MSTNRYLEKAYEILDSLPENGYMSGEQETEVRRPLARARAENQVNAIGKSLGAPGSFNVPGDGS